MITKEKAQEISVDAIYDFTRKMKDVKPDALMILGTFQVRDELDISECAVNAVSGDTAKMLNCLVNSAQQIANEIGAGRVSAQSICSIGNWFSALIWSFALKTMTIKGV